MPVIGTGVEICTSTTRPTVGLTTGTMIYETDTFSYRWYTGSAWVGMTPSGTTQSFAGSTEPPGWLFCFGQSLNATTNPIYADLFSAIGTTYGGSGVTAFSLPDLRGRSITGRDNMGGTAASRVTNSGTNNSGIAGSTLGAVGGDQRMHQHTHTQNSHSHSYSRGINIGFQHTPGSSTAYFHTYDTPQTGGTTATNQNTGTGTAQNMPPTIILNYIIKI